MQTLKWLIYGADGYIGQMFVKLLQDQKQIVIKATSRADDSKAVEQEIRSDMPDRIISCIGRTSGPGFNNIDYLEQKGKLRENIRDNLFGPFVLAHLSNKYGIHYSYLSTGCIYSGYNNYTENDAPDFFGSSYSTAKGFSNEMMKLYNNVLTLRIRMPITADMNPRNFITKILSYKKICSMPNSMSVLPELLPIMIDMAQKKVTGIMNMTNPGVISHNEILQMVKDIAKPDLKWENFTLEEQSKVLLADRSNNSLCTAKLEGYTKVNNIRDAVKNVIKEMHQKKLIN